MASDAVEATIALDEPAPQVRMKLTPASASLMEVEEVQLMNLPSLLFSIKVPASEPATSSQTTSLPAERAALTSTVLVVTATSFAASALVMEAVSFVIA